MTIISGPHSSENRDPFSSEPGSSERFRFLHLLFTYCSSQRFFVRISIVSGIAMQFLRNSTDSALEAGNILVSLPKSFQSRCQATGL